MTGANPRHAIPGENSEVARLSEMIVALLGELAISNERLDTIERLLDAGGIIPLGAIEDFAPEPGVQVERDGKRRRLIAKVFRPLRDAAGRLAGTLENR